jgi:Terpene cyclase DEP1
MTRTDKTLCALYGALAAVALVGTQWALLDFLRSDDSSMGAMTDALTANPVVGFVGIDLGVVALAAVVFMAVEGRRLRVPWWGVYVALVFLVAASVAFPLFLIARTRQLARQRVSVPA